MPGLLYNIWQLELSALFPAAECLLIFITVIGAVASELMSKKGGWFWQVNSRDKSLKIPFHGQNIAGVKANRCENAVCSGSHERTGERWNPNAGQCSDPFGLQTLVADSIWTRRQKAISLKERQPRPSLAQWRGRQRREEEFKVYATDGIHLSCSHSKRGKERVKNSLWSFTLGKLVNG